MHIPLVPQVGVPEDAVHFSFEYSFQPKTLLLSPVTFPFASFVQATPQL
jgi:hypothetical protein